MDPVSTLLALGIIALMGAAAGGVKDVKQIYEEHKASVARKARERELREQYDVLVAKLRRIDDKIKWSQPGTQDRFELLEQRDAVTLQMRNIEGQEL